MARVPGLQRGRGVLAPGRVPADWSRGRRPARAIHELVGARVAHCGDTASARGRRGPPAAVPRPEPWAGQALSSRSYSREQTPPRRPVLPRVGRAPCAVCHSHPRPTAPWLRVPAPSAGSGVRAGGIPGQLGPAPGCWTGRGSRCGRGGGSEGERGAGSGTGLWRTIGRGLTPRRGGCGWKVHQASGPLRPGCSFPSS